MISDLGWLCLLAVVMFAASFMAGVAPLAVSMSEQRLNVLAPYGAGILVGTALVVILPEGVATLYGGGGGHAHEETSARAEPDHFDGTAYVGPALLLGFLVMFLLDYFGPSGADGHAGHSHAHGLPTAAAATGSEVPLAAPSDGPALGAASGALAAVAGAPKPMFSSSFVGLLVHNIADGMAMGAASAGTNKSLETIVFLAIIMHKAPAAFGLCTLLLHEGRTRSTIRQMLAIFSAVPPVSAVLSFLILGAVDIAMPKHIWTGLVLLVSAGSFLYVAAVHVLPEVKRDPVDAAHDAYALGSGANGPFGLRPTNTRGLAIVLGMLTPLLLTGAGTHSH